STLVPVLAIWLLRETPRAEGRSLFDRIRDVYGIVLGTSLAVRWVTVLGYVVGSAVLIVSIGGTLGTDIFPIVDSGQFQLRLRAATGTRVEETERITKSALQAIREEAGLGNVAITLSFIGTVPPSYPINAIYLWPTGPHDAVLL